MSNSSLLRSLSVGLLASGVMLGACSGGGGHGQDAATPPDDAARPRVLFVGNSFTHGRYAPVRQYNAAHVIDENEGQRGARAEEDNEPGPYGGIPGLFAEFASQAGLEYEVHIEAMSSATLKTHIDEALDVIADPKWDVVVLQEQSTKPLPKALANGGISNPANFCASVDALERAIHGVAANADVYLYETWPRADTAYSLADGDAASDAYDNALAAQGEAFHDAYYRAAARNGKITAVAPVGDAWGRAWAQGVAEANPYSGSSALPSLWYGIETVNDPRISAPDRYHPSIYGAYLSALVLFQQITGFDVQKFGADENVASDLGIPSAIAVRLQQVASQTVQSASSALSGATADPCTAK